MLRSSKKWLPVLLVLGLSRDCQGSKPKMFPPKPEMYIEEGDSLELKCESTKKMKFYYPVDVAHAIETSPMTLELFEGDTEIIILRRPKTIYGDTGWYGCASYDSFVTPEIYDEPNVCWTYVYITSNTSYFVRRNNHETIHGVSGGTATLPCRPTSPHYDIKLRAGNRNFQVSYDPRFGFMLRNITVADSGFMYCDVYVVLYYLQRKGTREFTLIVKEKPPVLSTPTIIKDTVRHVTRGKTLYVNCTTEVNIDIQYDVFNWTTPQQDSRITTRLYREYVPGSKWKITCELTINELTDEDEGEYLCWIRASPTYKATNINIKFHDPNIKYINLTSPDNDRYYQRNYGDHIQWVVGVDAYPQPKLKWLDPRGNEIIKRWTHPEWFKHGVQTTLSSTILRINRLDFNDMGRYSLEATNEDRIETLYFTLEVLAKPKLSFDGLKAFYSLKQKAEIVCNITAFPAPIISWTFFKAPHYPSVVGPEMLKFVNYSSTPNISVFHSLVIMTIEMSGELICTACNTLGCNSESGLILISDVPDGFGIIETDNQLTEGDNVEIICAASRYKYIRVEWLDNTDDAVIATDRISMTNSSTNFTHRSTFRIKNLRKSDNDSYYVCSAIKDYNETVRSRYNLLIHDPMAPFFSETDMNKSTVVLDLSTEGYKPMTLKCRVQGLPKPNVTWYKDDTEICDDWQYECHHDNQELHMKYLHDKNSGRYTCTAENRFGKVENYQIILIKAKDVSKVLIISIVAFVLICVILVIYFYVKMHRGKVRNKQLMELGLTHFEEGALESLNPDLTVNDQAEILPYDKKWEFPRERLKFGKQLGVGAFGVVVKADAVGIYNDAAVSTVAVKMVRKSTRSTYIRALANELKIMVHVGKHLNVVNLLGACTNNIVKRDLLVIVEYCRFGNLHDYLSRHRADFIDQIDPATRKLDPSIGLDTLTESRGISTSSDGYVLSNNSIQPDGRSTYRGDHKDQNLKPICTQDLLSWAFQVARGMEYLSRRKVLHGDLAARNILLAENNIVKICDFGLAKTLYKDYNYKKKGDAPLPIKWMAIESIKNRVFSTQSDVWSFGIVLWEFFTLAKALYPSMDADMQYQKLVEGYRMEQPEHATDEIYDIMLQCWKAKPTLRPRFTDLVSSIGDLLEECVKAYYVDLNAPYMDMNAIVRESGKHDYLTMMSAPDHDALVSPNNDYVNSLSLSRAIPQDDSYLPMSPLVHGRDSDTSSPRIT